MHGDASFVTLTYDDQHLPADGSVSPKATQEFLKRLRERMRPRRLRFFLVGEYGDDTWRPHYHAALFGLPNCLRGRTEHRVAKCCQMCDLVRAAWAQGGIDCRELTMETAQYLVGYVAKKMTKCSDGRLSGRHPEFARMSLRPGIGAPAMEQVWQSLSAGLAGRSLSTRQLRVPTVLKHGSRDLPLGRYLRATLESEGRFIDREEARFLDAQELRALSESVGTAEAVATRKLAPEMGAILKIERKAKLFAKKGAL